MKRLLSALLLLACCAAAQAETRQLVMVTATPELATAPLTTREIRKIYLGHAITKNGRRIVPLINRSDPLAYQVFLQKVLLMSGPSYERLLLARVFRGGGSRPARFDSPVQLTETLVAQPNTISYMWAVDTQNDPRLRTIIELWRGQVR